MGDGDEAVGHGWVTDRLLWRGAEEGLTSHGKSWERKKVVIKQSASHCGPLFGAASGHVLSHAFIISLPHVIPPVRNSELLW